MTCLFGDFAIPARPHSGPVLLFVGWPSRLERFDDRRRRGHKDVSTCYVPCKTWRRRPVCFYIIATAPTLFDGTRTLPVHLYQLAREGISAEKAHATASVRVVAILVIDVTAYKLMNRFMRKYR